MPTSQASNDLYAIYVGTFEFTVGSGLVVSFRFYPDNEWFLQFHFSLFEDSSFRYKSLSLCKNMKKKPEETKQTPKSKTPKSKTKKNSIFQQNLQTPAPRKKPLFHSLQWLQGPPSAHVGFVLTRNGRFLCRKSFLREVFPEIVILLARPGIIGIAPIAINLHQVSPVYFPRPLPLSPDVGVVEIVGLRQDFGARVCHHSFQFAPQLRTAPAQFGLEALIESGEIFVVKSALDFDAFAIQIGGRLGSIEFVFAGGCCDCADSGGFGC